MSIIAEQTVGNITYQYVNDLYPVHSAITGTVAITKYGRIFSSVGPYDWCQNLKDNIIGSMSSYDNTAATTYTVGSWTNLNALTWTAGVNMSGFSLNGAQLAISSDEIGIMLVQSSHTYEAGTARWASLEAGPAINNIVPSRFNGGTHNSTAAQRVTIISHRVVELDGKIGNYINVGNRQDAQQAAAASSVRRHHQVVATELDEPIILVENGTSLSFNTNDWVRVNDSINKWEMGSATTFSGGGTSTYISNNGGVSNVYTNSASQISHFYRDFDFPRNLDSDIIVAFNWKSVGEAADYGKLYITNADTVISAGTAISESYNAGATKYNLQNTFTNLHTSDSFSGVSRFVVARRETLRGQSARLVFSWINDGSGGTNPPMSIDAFRISFYVGRYVDYGSIFLSGFEGASIESDGWTVVNGATNVWMNGTGDFRSGFSGSTQAAYISNNGVTPSYLNTFATVSHFYRDVVIPANKKIILGFDWKCVGENAAAATSYDYGTVVMAATGTTPVAGTEVSTTQATVGGNGRIGAVVNLGKFNTAYGSSGRWNYEELDLSAYAGQTKRLIFTWKNDNITGLNPPMTIDNMRLIYEDL